MMSYDGIKKEYMYTTTPPSANIHRYLAASTLLPVCRADAKAVVVVTPAVTTAVNCTKSFQGRWLCRNSHACRIARHNV